MKNKWYSIFQSNKSSEVRFVIAIFYNCKIVEIPLAPPLYQPKDRNCYPKSPFENFILSVEYEIEYAWRSV